VPGTVAYDVQNNIASFLPSGALKPSTNYTATVSTDATDLAGNALQSQTSGAIRNPWSFTTDAAVVPLVPSPIPLGAVATFGSYGGTAGMTSQGLNTFIDGDIGTTAVSTAVTGFHDTGGNSYTETPLNRGTVNGTIFTYPPAPGNATSMIAADAALAAAQAAYLQLKAMPGGAFAGAGELGLLTLAPGTYTSATTFNITSGDLTLDGQGDPNALFIFQVGQALTVGKAGPAGACSIILVNGAKAKNIFWQVGSSATINGAGGGTMQGTIIAQQAVSFSTAGNAAITTLNGRALSLISGVTMVNTHIFLPAP
jgi:ice-binding like protein/Big-like domain-containing protein